MPYRGADKTAVRTFFTRFSQPLKTELQSFANNNHRLPSVNEFINIIDNFISNAPAGQIPINMINTMTPIKMQDDTDLIGSYLDALKTGITIPAVSAPPPAAIPIVRGDGAILADGSAAAQSAAITTIGLSVADASACTNIIGMSTSSLRGDNSSGIFFHNTVHSSTSSYGVKDNNDGIYKMTCIYDLNSGSYYIIGIARHYGTEKVPGKRDPVDKYRVQFSLIPTLIKGDILHFR